MLSLAVRAHSWTVVFSVVVAALALSASSSRGQEAAPPAAAGRAAEEASESSADASARRSPRGRLPAFYREVVDENQRETIYKLQADYAPRIAEVRAQLDALIAERDGKVAAVLTPQQRQKVEQLREAARAARQSRASEPAKPGT